MNLLRALRHLFATRWGTRRRFPETTLAAIEAAVREVESRHAGEIRFAVETALDLPELWSGLSARERALQVFGELGVWDTAGNNGVLVYVLVADRDVEIVADRGIHAHEATPAWGAICRQIEAACARGDHEAGAKAGIEAVANALRRHFPRPDVHGDELPNEPVLL